VSEFPSYAEFCQRVPLVDVERIKFELDFDRRVAMGSAPVTLASRLYGLAFAMRLKVPDPYTGRFEAGVGRWSFPWNWHRLYYRAKVQAHEEIRARRASLSLVDPAGIPVERQARPQFTNREVTRLKRAWRNIRRAELQRELRGEEQ
jgi:hypothetical protein